MLLPYDRPAALRYAARWALARNPAYADFSLLGGDCANFVSQCLFAGAPRMDYTRDTGWYFRSIADRAPAWSGVLFLHRYLLRSAGPGPVGQIASLAGLLPGDIVFLKNSSRLYHALLLAAPGPAPDDPLMAAHTADSWLRPLSSYDPSAFVPVHIAGFRP